MNACTRSSAPRRSSPIMIVARPSSRTRSTSFLRSVTSGTRSRLRGLNSSAPSSSPSISFRCGRSHGTPPNCSACVISCSATQRSSWSAGASEALGRVGEVGRDEQQPRGLVGLEHRELVLAEHAAREEARRPRRPRSPARRPRARRAARRCPRSAAPRAPAPPPARQVGLDPARRDRRPPPPAPASPARARCRPRRAARPPPPAPRAARTGPGSPAGCRFATPRATVPARFQSITCSRMAGANPKSALGPDGHLRHVGQPGRGARGDHRRVRLRGPAAPPAGPRRR